MADDIAPDLLKKILDEMDAGIASDSDIQKILEKIGAGTATHIDTQAYAIAVGEHESTALLDTLTTDVLPDGRMYYNIAERTVRPAIEQAHELVNEVAGEIQTALNQAAGLGMRAISPAIDDDRVAGIINRLTSAENFDDARWLLGEPIRNITQSFADDYVRANADFQAQSGLHPKITRTLAGGCCDWCAELAGTYSYPDVPEDVYRRHRYCRCMVTYDPGDGRRQNVHSKKWYDSQEEAEIEQKKSIDAAASPRFVSRTDNLYKNAAKVKPEAGFTDVVVHGDKYGFVFKNSDGVESLVSVDEFASILKGSSLYSGGDIRLMSCEAGADGAIPAQRLADALRVRVKAPSDVLWISEEGEMTIGQRPHENTGEWRIFTPKGEKG